jgi:hypothetical protein
VFSLPSKYYSLSNEMNMYYKSYRIEDSGSGLSLMVWKGSTYLNTFNSFEAAKKAIDEGQFE